MADRLYLHEVIDITGQGAVPYMEHTVGFKAEHAADRGLTLLGTWYVVGSTGRWPQVVNVWEMVDGWEGWGRLLSSTNLRRAENRELSEWWDEAAQWRTGGFDRLLGAAAGSPLLEELRRDGVTGELFVHEIAEVRPGAATDYLQAVIGDRVPVMAEHGHTLVGAYNNLLSDTEVVSVWATDLASHLDLMETRTVDEALGLWHVEALSWVTSRREELMVPHEGTPLYAPPAS